MACSKAWSTPYHIATVVEWSKPITYIIVKHTQLQSNIELIIWKFFAASFKSLFLLWCFYILWLPFPDNSGRYFLKFVQLKNCICMHLYIEDDNYSCSKFFETDFTFIANDFSFTKPRFSPFLCSHQILFSETFHALSPQHIFHQNIYVKKVLELVNSLCQNRIKHCQNIERSLNPSKNNL